MRVKFLLFDEEKLDNSDFGGIIRQHLLLGRKYYDN
jgi:hypothetical protein